MKKTMISSMVFVALICTITNLNAQNCTPCGPDGWAYVADIPIDNTGNSNTLTDYQVLIYVNTQTPIQQGKMDSTGKDIRFTSDCSTLLNYWIEGPMNSDSTKIWVKVPVITAGSLDTIHINYGNPNATAMSDPDSTFDLFDDFDDGIFNTQKWEERGTFNTVNESGGKLTLAGSSNWEYIRSLSVFTNPVIIESKYQQGSSAGLVLGITATDNRFTFRMNGANLGTTWDNNVSSSNSWWNTGYPGIIAPSSNSDSINVVAQMNGPYINCSSFCNISQNACNNNSTDLSYFTGSSFYIGFSSWNTSSTMIIDVIRVRKYTSPEPTTTVDQEQPNSSLSITTAGTDMQCNNDSSGVATTTPTGGFTPYTYQWDANTGSQTDSSATGLGAGTYMVTVTDNNGCTDVDTVTLSEPPALTLSVTANDDVEQSCVGNATAYPGGGIPPYTYQWDANTGNQTLQTATALCEGTYFVSITDGNGCIISDSAVIGNVSGISNNSNSTFITAYPNPTKGELSVQIVNVKEQNLNFTIQNTIGEIVYSVSLKPSSGVITQAVDLSDQPKGVYLLKLTSSVGSYISRIILR